MAVVLYYANHTHDLFAGALLAASETNDVSTDPNNPGTDADSLEIIDGVLHEIETLVDERMQIGTLDSSVNVSGIPKFYILVDNPFLLPGGMGVGESGVGADRALSWTIVLRAIFATRVHSTAYWDQA